MKQAETERGDMHKRLRVYVVQWHGDAGWWPWSGHITRNEAWKEMRIAREMARTEQFRVVTYMPEKT